MSTHHLRHRCNLWVRTSPPGGSLFCSVSPASIARDTRLLPNVARQPRTSRVLCSFQWQCYVPTLALLVNKDMGREITDVGWLYLAFVGMSIVSSFSLHAHLRHFTPYTVSTGAHKVLPS